MSGHEILANEKPFVPYGITVFGLAYPDWQGREAGDLAQIESSASTWHANTVRIQVSPTDLLGSNPYDTAYLAATAREISTGRALGMAVILSAQYERSGPIPMPNASTESFWRIMAPRYANDPGVWFDLFNEPRLPAPVSGAITASMWDIWRNGGASSVGMQDLSNVIRRYAPDNIILAEGLQKAETLNGVQGYLLTGGAIVYSVHPYFSGPMYSSPEAWGQNWGNISASIPVLVGEWGEYEGRQKNCHADAASLVSMFLDFLSQHNIGLIAWALIPHVLVTDLTLSTPTVFTPNTPFVCHGTSASGITGVANATPSGGGAPFDGQGPGAEVLAYFAGHSRPAPRS